MARRQAVETSGFRAMIEGLEGRTFFSVAAGSVPWLTPRVQSVGAEIPAVSADPAPIANATESPAVSLTTSKSPVGGNLNVESDRVQDHPFTDLVKTTRGFYNLAGRLTNGKQAFAYTDSYGWPTEDFALSVADNAEFGVAIDKGVYKMSFNGPAGVTVAVRRTAPGGAGTVPSTAPTPTLVKTGYNAATSLYTYDINVPAGVLTLALDFKTTGGKVRNLHILQPGYSLSGYPTFSNEYVNLLRNLAPNVLRFKDWTHTDNNLTTNWSDRPKTTDATQAKVTNPGDLQPAKGIAWEYVIQLANTIKSNVWVNLPVRATDDYVKQLASMLRTQLDPSLTIYVEFSNETWNGGYEQAGYLRRLAGAEVVAAKKAGKTSDLNYDNLPVDLSKADGGSSAYTWADRIYARRSKQIADLFKSVWTSAGQASPINGRVRVVLASQVAVPGRFDTMLKYVNTKLGTPKTWFYSLGVAPYINLGSNQNVNGLTVDQVLNSLQASVNALNASAALGSVKSKANTYGLKMQAYEGGIDTYGSASISAKRLASLDSRINAIVQNYLKVWFAKGGGQFNWYTIGARSFNSPYGSWSITEDIRNTNQPKELGFKAIRDAGLGLGN